MSNKQIEQEINRLRNIIAHDIKALYQDTLSDQEAYEATDRLISFFRILLETDSNER